MVCFNAKTTRCLGQMPGNRIIGNELFGETPKEVAGDLEDETCLLVLVIGWNRSHVFGFSLLYRSMI